MVKQTNICTIGVSIEREEIEKRAESLFNEIMTGKLQKLGKRNREPKEFSKEDTSK